MWCHLVDSCLNKFFLKIYKYTRSQMSQSFERLFLVSKIDGTVSLQRAMNPTSNAEWTQTQLPSNWQSNHTLYKAKSFCSNLLSVVHNTGGVTGSRYVLFIYFNNYSNFWQFNSLIIYTYPCNNLTFRYHTYLIHSLHWLCEWGTLWLGEWPCAL